MPALTRYQQGRCIDPGRRERLGGRTRRCRKASMEARTNAVPNALAPAAWALNRFID
jgi:hypothetical protein